MLKSYFSLYALTYTDMMDLFGEITKGIKCDVALLCSEADINNVRVQIIELITETVHARCCFVISVLYYLLMLNDNPLIWYVIKPEVRNKTVSACKRYIMDHGPFWYIMCYVWNIMDEV